MSESDGIFAELESAYRSAQALHSALAERTADPLIRRAHLVRTENLRNDWNWIAKTLKETTE